MEITDVKVIPVDDEKLKAFVSIVFDQSFVVTDIKIINGPKGLFVSMPSKKRKDGTFKDIAHPLNNQMRQYLEDKVLSVYRQQVAGAPRIDGIRESLEVDRVALGSHLEDHVPQAHAATLSPEGTAEAAVELLGGGQPLLLGSLHRLHRRQHRRRPGPIGGVPGLPAGAWGQCRAGLPLDGQLVARGWLRVEELEREDAMVEGDRSLQAKPATCVVQAPDRDVRPGAADVAEHDDRAGADLDHRLSRG